MILASSITHDYELLGSRLVVIIGLLLLWLALEKPLLKLHAGWTILLIPLLVYLWGSLVDPQHFLNGYRLRHLNVWAIPGALLLAICLLGFVTLWRQAESRRSQLAYGLIGLAPMPFALSSLPESLLQSAFAAVVFHQCLRHGTAPEFACRLIRTCTRSLLILLPLTWLLGSWEAFKLLDAMTGEGKQAMLLISYFGIAKHISFELLLLLPLLIWLLRQDRLRPHEAPQAQECRSSL